MVTGWLREGPRLRPRQAAIGRLRGGQERGFDSAAPTWPESPSPQTAVGAVLGRPATCPGAGARPPGRLPLRPVHSRRILYEMRPAARPSGGRHQPRRLPAIIDDAPEPLAVLCRPCPRHALGHRPLPRQGPRGAVRLDARPRARAARAAGAPRGVTSSPSSPGRRPVAPGAAGGSPPRAPGPRGGRHAVVAGRPPLRGGDGEARPASRPAREAHRGPPLPDLRGTPDDRALAEGLAELLTVRLAQLERFQSSLWVEPSGNVLQAGVTSAPTPPAPSGHARRERERHAPPRAPRADGDPGGRPPEPGPPRVTAESIDALVDGVVRMLELELLAPEAAALRAAASGVAEAATLATQGFGYTPYARAGPPSSATSRSRRSSGHRPLQPLPRAGSPLRPRSRRPRGSLLAALSDHAEAEQVALARQHCERALVLDDLSAVPWLPSASSRPARAGRRTRSRSSSAPWTGTRARRRAPRAGRRLRAARADEDAEAAYARAIELRPASWANHNYRERSWRPGGATRRRRRPSNRPWPRSRQRARLVEPGCHPAAARAAGGRGGGPPGIPRPPAHRVGSREPRRPPVLGGPLGRAARTLERATALDRLDYRLWHASGPPITGPPGSASVPRRLHPGRRARRRGAPARSAEPACHHPPRRLQGHARSEGRGASPRPGGARRSRGERPGRAHRGRRLPSSSASGGRPPLARGGASGGHPRGEIERDPGLAGLREDPRYKALKAVAPGG